MCAKKIEAHITKQRRHFSSSRRSFLSQGQDKEEIRTRTFLTASFYCALSRDLTQPRNEVAVRRGQQSGFTAIWKRGGEAAPSRGEAEEEGPQDDWERQNGGKTREEEGMEEEEDYVGSLQCVWIGACDCASFRHGGGRERRRGRRRRRAAASAAAFVRSSPLPRSVTSFPQTHRVTDIHTTYYTSNNTSKGRGLLIE